MLRSRSARRLARTRPLLTVVVATALVTGALAGCGDDAPSAEDTTTTSPTASDDGATTTDPAEGPAPVEEDPTFVEEPCWWEIPGGDVPTDVSITCGTVEVPADRTDPDSDVIELAVARLHRADGDADAEPVLYLHGGPGGDALVEAPVGLANLDVLGTRDVVTFDQRGAGRTVPSLNCPEKEEAILDALGAAGTWEDEYQANVDAVQACYSRLTEDEGIDLDAYDTPASVADVESLRRAFAVEQWNVWGVSYGTRLGLAYAREHPEAVRSLVIDSVYPPEVGGVERAQSTTQDALDRLVAACAADEGCDQAIGDLGGVLDDALASLDAEPEELTRTIRWGGEDVERTFVLTGPDLRAGMFAALYDSDLIPLLPSVIAGLAAGDRGIVPTYIDVGVPRLIDLSEGAFYSVECADSGRALAGAEAEAALRDVGQDTLVALNAAQVFCQDWPVEHVDEEFATQAVPDVPTLVFAGTLDPITPFADSEAQAEAMPDARFVAVPHGGHGVASYDACTRSARDAIWSDPSSELPACAADIEAVPFEVAG